MPRPSGLSARLPRSGIRQLMELAAHDPRAIRLEMGEPDEPTPEHVIAAAAADARAGLVRYTPSAGLPELREAIAAHETARGRRVGWDQVVVTHGAMQGLSATIAATLDPGDVLAVPDPEFPNWRLAATLAGVTTATYPARAAAGFVPDPDEVARGLDPRTRALLVCSPNNPTGAVYPPDVLTGLVGVAAARDAWVISDECYRDLAFDVPVVSAAAGDRDGRVVTVHSFSKSYAMTGWRLGYVVTPDPALARLVAQVGESSIACPSAIAQRAALAALAGPQDVVAAGAARYRERRDLATALLDARGIGHVCPDGAFYLLVDIAPDTDSHAFALRLLADHHVAVSPGAAFGPGAEGFVRVSLAAPTEDILTGLSLLADALEAARERRDREGPR